jgi:hypothetical protein
MLCNRTTVFIISLPTVINPLGSGVRDNISSGPRRGPLAGPPWSAAMTGSILLNSSLLT